MDNPSFQAEEATVSSSGSAIKVSGLFKSFGKRKNKTLVLSDINLDVKQNTIYGLLGASGCGKTTLLSCILGILNPDKGNITTLGGKPGTKQSGIPGQRVGYMPQEVALYDQFRCAELLHLFGRINSMNADKINERIAILERLLDVELGRKFMSQYSGGQRRRVSLAISLLHEPELLCLDEPTVGLDSVLRNRIWKHLLDLTEHQKSTIFITTHYIEETRQATRVGLIYNGSVIVERNPLNLLNEMNLTTLEEAFLSLCSQETVKEENIQETNRHQIAVRRFSSEQEQIQISTVNNSSVSDGNHINGTVTNGACVIALTKFSSTSSLYSDKTSEQNQSKSTSMVSGNWTTFVNFDHLFALVKKNYLCFFRNPLFLGYFFIFPLLIEVMFNLVLGGDMRDLQLAFVNNDVPEDPFCTPLKVCASNNLSCSFVEYLHTSQEILLRPYRNIEEATESVKQGTNWAAMEIPTNFSVSFVERIKNGVNTTSESLTNSNVLLFLDKTNKPVSSIVTTMIQRAISKTTVEYLNICGLNPETGSLAVKIEAPIYGPSSAPVFSDALMTGMTGIVIYHFVAMFASTNYVREKWSGMLNRFRVCGVSSVELYLAYFTIYYIIIMIQITIIYLFVFLPFKVPMVGSVALQISLLALQGTAGFCLGFLVSVFCAEDFQAIMIVFGIFAVNFLAGGVLWPVEAMPTWISSVFYFGPNVLAGKASMGILLRGWTFTHPGVYPGFIASIVWIVIPVAITFLLTRH